MMLKNLKTKIIKRFVISSRIDNFRTLFYRLKFKFPRNTSFHIYPNAILIVAKTASIELINGQFSINRVWLKGLQKKYHSELIMSEGSLLRIEDDFSMYQGASIIIEKGASLIIKGRSYLNTNSYIRCHNRIEIGFDTYISGNVTIRDSDLHFIIENGIKKNNTKPVNIGNHVWIGENVTILKGVNIGDGAVIASNAVVTKNVLAGTIVAGNPAKVIRENIDWE